MDKNTLSNERLAVRFVRLIFAVLILFCAFQSRAATVTFTMTNSIGQPDTNRIRLQPISSYVNADGSFQTTGFPFWIYPNTNGFVSTNLNAGNWIATNQFIVTQWGTPGFSSSSSQGIIFAVPNSAGTFPAGQLAIPGYNVYNYNGLGSSTTNPFGFTPLTPQQTTNLVASSTNGFSTLVFTNPAAVLYTNALPALTNGFVMASITNGLATTNYVQSITNTFWNSNAVAAAILAQGAADTNYAKAATNGLAISSGLMAFHSTNDFATYNFTTNLVATNPPNLTLATGTLNISQIIVTTPGALSGYGDGLYTTNPLSLTPSANSFLSSNNVASLIAIYTNPLATKAYVLSATNTIATSDAAALNSASNTIISYVNTATNTTWTNASVSLTLASNVLASAITTATNNAVLSANQYTFLTSNLLWAIYNSGTNTISTNTAANLNSASNAIVAYVSGLGYVTAAITNTFWDSNGVAAAVLAQGAKNTNFTLTSINTASNNMVSIVQSTNNLNLILTTNLITAQGTANTNYSVANSNSLVSIIVATNTASLIATTNLVVASTNGFSPIVKSNSWQFVSSQNGNVTNLTLQGQFVIGNKTNFVYATNTLGLSSSGSMPSGTWYGTSTALTNVFNPVFYITFSAGNYYAMSNAVTLYASTDGQTWTLVSGVNPVPVGHFGHLDYNDGTTYLGWFYSTNLTAQMKTVAQNATNGIAIPSGLMAFQPTNAWTTWNAFTNATNTIITSGGISASTATNISSTVATNISVLKNSGTGTNVTLYGGAGGAYGESLYITNSYIRFSGAGSGSSTPDWYLMRSSTGITSGYSNYYSFSWPQENFLIGFGNAGIGGSPFQAPLGLTQNGGVMGERFYSVNGFTIANNPITNWTDVGLYVTNRPLFETNLYSTTPTTATATTSITNTTAYRGTWALLLQLTETGNAATFTVFEPGIDTNQITAPASASQTFTNYYQFPIQPGYTNSLIDQSGVGASVTVLKSYIIR